MAKVDSRTRTSKSAKKKSGGKPPKSASDTSGGGTAPKPVDRQYVLGMTEEEGMQVYQARCMLQLLEDMALFAEREITISRGSLVVMMALIREKLSCATRSRLWKLSPIQEKGTTSVTW